MSKAAIVRTDMDIPPAGPALDAVRSFLFRCVQGVRKEDQSVWNRLWRRITSMEPGELFELEIVFPRNPKFHRKYFALLNLGFDSWEPARKRKTYKGIPVEKNFDQFREDITILAGFYTQTFDLDGRMVLKAKSIKFSKMDDAEFERLYDATATVLLDRVFTQYKGREELDEVVAKVLEFTR